MLPLRKTKQRFFTFLALVVITILAYSFLFWMLAKKADEVSVLATEARSIEERAESVRAAENLLRETELERRVLTDSFVAESRIIDFISELESLGPVSGTLLEIASVDAVQGEQGQTLNVEISALGSWDSVYHLLSLVEVLPYHVTITSFSIEQHSEAEGDTEWRLIINLSAPLIS